ncbi:hypothetical protein [Aeromonas dhakensis]|uniref:hypothetical protein n=1 Tax=Aeromonas dhakensis TaxID=196024 RepID=UPI0035710D69
MDKTKKCFVARGYGESTPAEFHRWSDTIVYDDGNQPHNLTVAIVEYEDGQIAQVEPPKLKFAK